MLVAPGGRYWNIIRILRFYRNVLQKCSIFKKITMKIAHFCKTLILWNSVVVLAIFIIKKTHLGWLHLPVSWWSHKSLTYHNNGSGRSLTPSNTEHCSCLWWTHQHLMECTAHKSLLCLWASLSFGRSARIPRWVRISGNSAHPIWCT